MEVNDRHGAAAPDRDGRPPVRRSGGRHWQPIVILEERLSFETLVGLYRHADLMLVSSVYDGMNLVAKEYVASQVQEAGVLLVSEMAGAAEQLTDAVLINPYDLEGLADAVREALEMPAEERQRRMRSLRATVAAFDIHQWVEACLHDAGFPIGAPEAVS
jgi:trehalose-6-phosphate synthase